MVWLFGQGFPKNTSISRQLEKKEETRHAAAQWEGWGSHLKPAAEFITVARKPLTGTIAANVLEWGTGGINVDACRVGAAGGTKKGTFPNQPSVTAYGNGLNGACEITPINAGRFPPNVLFSHLPECRQVGTKRVKGTSIPRDQPMVATRRSGVHSEAGGHQSIGREQPVKGHADPDGLETVEAWDCAEGCPVKELDEQSGTLISGKPGNSVRQAGSATFKGLDQPIPLTGYGDSGGASRFFPAFRYQAKASRRERDEGLEGMELRAPTVESAHSTVCLKCNRQRVNVSGACQCANPEWGRVTQKPVANVHPCVKPVALMQWLVRLVTPPNGVVLDPFTGSGTTGVAAILEGFRFIGCEREDEYFAIAKARLDNAEKQHQAKQPPLFDLEAS